MSYFHETEFNNWAVSKISLIWLKNLIFDALFFFIYSRAKQIRLFLHCVHTKMRQNWLKTHIELWGSLMSCPSMDPKGFWTDQIILVK